MHFIPSIIILAFSLCILIVPGPSGDFIIFYTIPSSLLAALIPFLYLYVGLQVEGEPRVKSFLMGSGLIIFMIGNIFYTDIMQEAIPLLVYISPLMMIAGIGLYHYGLLIYSKIS